MLMEIRAMKPLRMSVSVLFLKLIAPSMVMADGTAEYLTTPYGFYFWLGSAMYHTEMCGIQFPDRLVDVLAAKAGISKQMVAEEGSKGIAEGYAEAQKIFERDGLDVTCMRSREALGQ